MTTADTPAPSRGRQLAAQAAEAAEVRDALTHPDVVALRVEKLRARVDRFIWTGMILGLLFTMTNVQQFTAHTLGAGPGSLGWWAAWLLDPTVSVILLGVLLAEREVSRWQIPVGPWARAAKWSLLSATYVMNTWESWAAGNLAGIVLHSVPPLAVFTGAEAVTDCQDKLTEAVHRAHAWATQRADRKAHAEGDKADRDRHAPQPATEQTPPATGGNPPGPVAPAPAPAPIPAPAPAPFPATSPRAQTGLPVRSADRPGEPSTGRPPDRSETAHRTGPGGRSESARPDRSESARRSGPARARRTGTPRSDAQLTRAVRDLAAQNGAPPSQYQIKQRFGVGSGRAARLLADLATTGPPGPATGNGAATRREDPR